MRIRGLSKSANLLLWLYNPRSRLVYTNNSTDNQAFKRRISSKNGVLCPRIRNFWQKTEKSFTLSPKRRCGRIAGPFGLVRSPYVQPKLKGQSPRRAEAHRRRREDCQDVRHSRQNPAPLGGSSGQAGVRTLIQFLSRIILGGFLETAPRWLPARLDLAVIGCRIRPCRYNLPVGLGDVRMRPMLVANRLGMARCGCRNDRFCHAAKPAGSGR